MSMVGTALQPPDRLADLRLLVPALTAWAVCWWVTRVDPASAGIACAAGVLLCLLAAATQGRLVMMGAAALVAAAASAGLHMAALSSGPLPDMARSQERVDAVVTVASDPVVHQATA